MATKKKNVRKKTGRKTEKFDSTKDYVFGVEVVLGPNTKRAVEFAVKAKENLSYDDVLDAISELVEKDYPQEYFPKLEVDYSTLVIYDGGGAYPVFAESEAEKMADELKGHFKKFLVLPECTYSLSEEYRLYERLVRGGMIDPDATPFDFERMKAVLAGISTGEAHGNE